MFVIHCCGEKPRLRTSLPHYLQHWSLLPEQWPYMAIEEPVLHQHGAPCQPRQQAHLLSTSSRGGVWPHQCKWNQGQRRFAALCCLWSGFQFSPLLTPVVLWIPQCYLEGSIQFSSLCPTSSLGNQLCTTR